MKRRPQRTGRGKKAGRTTAPRDKASEGQTRSQQRDATRARIIEAAAQSFAARGFRGASTREIAARARANQGLITYHFHSKEELWKAAADHIFDQLRRSLERIPQAGDSGDTRALARDAIRQYVRFVAAHPELFWLMVEEGKQKETRLHWLVDKHLKAIYGGFVQLVERYNPAFDRTLIPHLYYTLAGAGSMIFALGPECRRLTGLDPAQPRAVEAHAELVALLLVR